MSKQVNMHEAKTHFSKIAQAAEAGEEVIIARAGKPVLKLVRIEQVQEPIKPGFAKELLADWESVNWVDLDKKFNQLFKGE
jgi:prevent-host-death family protein